MATNDSWRRWLPHRWGERAAYALIRFVYRVLGVRNPPPGSQIRDSSPDLCRCTEGAYLGAQLLGTPLRCERCRGLVDERALQLLDRIYAESIARLQKWSDENPM